MEALALLLIIVVFFSSAILLVVAPFTAPALAFYLMRRYGIGIRPAALFTVIPLLVLIAWLAYGIYELNGRCLDASIKRATSEKYGPVDALLIDGPGMWWLNGKIDVERLEYGREGKTDKYWRLDAGTEHRRPGRRLLSEAELRSRFKVTIGQPHESNFWARYQSSAAITIEDRSTGNLVARFDEPALGGGLAGSYIAALSKLNPFYSSNRYLSCGYAGKEIGIFRGDSKERSQHYRVADQNLIEQVFTLATNN